MPIFFHSGSPLFSASFFFAYISFLSKIMRFKYFCDFFFAHYTQDKLENLKKF
jgi:hypothetical protein